MFQIIGGKAQSVPVQVLLSSDKGDVVQGKLDASPKHCFCALEGLVTSCQRGLSRCDLQRRRGDAAASASRGD